LKAMSAAIRYAGNVLYKVRAEEGAAKVHIDKKESYGTTLHQLRMPVARLAPR